MINGFKQSMLRNTLGLLLLLLPWHTCLITREVLVGGAKHEYATLGFYATEILLWFAVFLFIGNLLLVIRDRGISKFRLTKDRLLLLSILLFVLWSYISITWAIDQDVAIQSALRMLEAALVFVLILVGPLERRDSMKFLALGMVIPSIFGIMQFAAQTSFASTLLGLSQHLPEVAGVSVVASESLGRVLRAYGSFTHPNVFGGFAALTLIFTLLLSLTEKQDKKFFYHSLVVLLTAAVALSFSRSAWLLAALGIVAAFMHKSSIDRMKKLFGKIILTVLILAIPFSSLFSARLFGSGIHEERSITERQTGVVEALSYFYEKPLVGYGVGNYTFVTKQMNPELAGWALQPVHNVFLLLLVELGVVGLLLLTLIGLAAARFANWKELLFWSVILLPILVFDHYIYSSYVGLMLFAIFVGIIMRPRTQVVHK
jgi:O-antigen ligase